MYVKRNIRWSVIWRFGWKNVLLFTLWSVIVTGLFIHFESRMINLGIPFLPLSTIGIAVAFYIGFKNSQSYDRFWEGRKVWGKIVNTSRALATKCISYLKDQPNGHDEARRMVRRHMAWMNALRMQLRRTTIFDRKNLSYVPDFGLNDNMECKDCVAYFLEGDEYEETINMTNPASQLLRIQMEHLARLKTSQALDSFEHMTLVKDIDILYDQQGKCERIKNTPFPRQYAYFSSVFVWVFILLLPFGLTEEFHAIGGESTVWLTVPFSVLISWIFSTMEVVGDNSEDPFENYVNDVPMSAICRTIEIDLMEMLNEPKDTIPQKIQPINDVLL